MDKFKVYSDESEIGIKGTPKTPFIWFLENGDVYITGKSIPEESGEFYSEITVWLNDTLEICYPELKLHIDLEFINGGSVKYLHQLLYTIKGHCEKMKVIWNYQDNQPCMLELGEIISAGFDADFKLSRKE